MTAVKLYSFPLVIGLTEIDRGVRNNNLSLTDSDFKVYKGASNPIEFIVRDNDRRPIPLIGKTVTMTVINFFTGATMIQKEADVIDAAKGKLRVILTPADTSDWEVSFYKYSMLIDHCEGNLSTLLFVDQNQNATGFFEFIDGVLPEPSESFRVLGSEFTPTNAAPPTTEPTNFISSGFPGDSVFCEDDGLHTVVVYATNFAGKFFVQGSLEEVPGAEETDWFDIFLTALDPYFELGNTPTSDDTFTGLEAFNFTGSLRWVRFKYIADQDNPGVIDKVLYRN